MTNAKGANDKGMTKTPMPNEPEKIKTLCGKSARKCQGALNQQATESRIKNFENLSGTGGTVS
jgi:hypothetical protein